MSRYPFCFVGGRCFNNILKEFPAASVVVETLFCCKAFSVLCVKKFDPTQNLEEKVRILKSDFNHYFLLIGSLYFLQSQKSEIVDKVINVFPFFSSSMCGWVVSDWSFLANCSFKLRRADPARLSVWNCWETGKAVDSSPQLRVWWKGKKNRPQTRRNDAVCGLKDKTKELNLVKHSDRFMEAQLRTVTHSFVFLLTVLTLRKEWGQMSIIQRPFGTYRSQDPDSNFKTL